MTGQRLKKRYCTARRAVIGGLIATIVALAVLTNWAELWMIKQGRLVWPLYPFNTCIKVLYVTLTLLCMFTAVFPGLRRLLFNKPASRLSKVATNADPDDVSDTEWDGLAASDKLLHPIISPDEETLVRASAPQGTSVSELLLRAEENLRLIV